ncbi:TPA: VOC family protein [Staphylococcus aureus]|nr:VOC family protein [Staphylococcus aureus]
MILKFDHIIHYIDQLDRFSFPGDVIKLHSGGYHHKYGTFNKLGYINENYIELLDVENNEKLKKMAKTIEGGVAFATQIVQEKYEQGFKNICLRTNDIEAVKNKLQSEQVEVVAPIQMERDTHKDGKIKWQLLYIMNQDDDEIKPPFFIQWEESDSMRTKKLQKYFQKQFSIETVIVKSKNRSQTVSNWLKWFDMDIVEENDHYTDLILKNDDIYFRIEDGKVSKYHSVIIKDAQATSPYSIFIRGAIYRFEPLV